MITFFNKYLATEKFPVAMAILTACIMGFKTIAQPGVAGSFKLADYSEWSIAAIFFGARIMGVILTFIVAKYKYSHFCGVLIAAISMILFGTGMILFSTSNDVIWLVAVGVAAYGWGGIAISQANASTMGQIAKHNLSFIKSNANLTMLNIYKAVGMTAAAVCFTWGIHHFGTIKTLSGVGVACVIFGIGMIARKWGKIEVKKIEKKGEPKSNGGLTHLLLHQVVAGFYGAWFAVVTPITAASLYSEIWIGWVSAATAFGYGVCFVTGWWCSWKGYNNVNAWATAMLIVGAGLITMIQNPVALVVGTAIAAFGVGAIWVAAHAQVVARSAHTVSTQMWMEKTIAAGGVTASGLLIIALRFDLQNWWVAACCVALVISSIKFYKREIVIVDAIKKEAAAKRQEEKEMEQLDLEEGVENSLK